ncbi:MAG: phosphoribosylformylglycinamidine synthase subunit PurL [Candidatus Eremiobacteraeota bacterium]|nr:phosphoribosylformylglycinamidine synthase subunit PurL [Candidatus Eremiobacteraeota bacterium]MBC5823055.1 phosphoribosylformylglycinamidine synthase subunit PurL [Candidatus Eremiobacteraeota bacterium]
MAEVATARSPVLRVRDADDPALTESLRQSGLALTLDEVRRIASTLERDPTIVEAHAFDAQWSEHCSYKSSRHHLARLPTTGPTVMQGPQEDAGIVHLGEWRGKRYGIVIAHESHNHPSQVVPFEGAATGVGGIVRDVLCMGARVIALADPLRFGPLEDPHCRYVAQGIVDGIAAYGNAIGVPTIAGDVYVHEGFRDNCLVNVVALGLIDEAGIIHSAAPPGSAGWDIVLVGKATDRSGFGGAAFSSLVLDEADAQQNRAAVQVPDPFLKNVLMRASYRAFDTIRERGLTVGFKDLGAGGIMGCTAELAAGGGFGARIDLDRCPTSQPNLPAAVVAVGETQERLAWVVPPEFTPTLLGIYNDEFSLPLIAEQAQAAVIGTITAEPSYVLLSGGETVMNVPIDVLTRGVRYERDYVLPIASSAAPPEAMTQRRLGDILPRVLAHRDVCSRRAIYERFDSVVRGTTSIPSGYADAGLIVPLPGAPLACALAVDGNPRYAVLDPERAAEHAVVESIRNVVAVGAIPAGMTDCLNYGNPENARHMGEFVAGIDGLATAARELGVPFVSGNVSLYNQSAAGCAIPASPIVACVGTLADVSRSATPALKKIGSVLYRLGTVPPGLGGSVVAEVLGITSDVPSPDYDATRREIAALLQAHRDGLVLAAHDVSDGGLLVTLCEMAFYAGAEVGVLLDVELDVHGAFAESGAFVVETGRPAEFEALCARHGAALTRLGMTIAEPVVRGPRGLDIPLSALHEAWTAPLNDFYADVLPDAAHA